MRLLPARSRGAGEITRLHRAPVHARAPYLDVTIRHAPQSLLEGLCDGRCRVFAADDQVPAHRVADARQDLCNAVLHIPPFNAHPRPVRAGESKVIAHAQNSPRAHVHEQQHIDRHKLQLATPVGVLYPHRHVQFLVVNLDHFHDAHLGRVRVPLWQHQLQLLRAPDRRITFAPVRLAQPEVLQAVTTRQILQRPWAGLWQRLPWVQPHVQLTPGARSALPAEPRNHFASLDIPDQFAPGRFKSHRPVRAFRVRTVLRFRCPVLHRRFMQHACL